jgi:N-acetylglucosaminyl-diphospho-decaprenol L-rhamnosyltransferase
MFEENKNCTVVITTFFAGEKLESCIKNIPEIFNILIIDNGGEKDKKIYFESKFKNLNYYVSNENLGVPKSYSLANKIVKTKYMFNTQPDVIVKKNCIENLLKKTKIYPNFAILSPTIFHNKLYVVEGDYKVLKIKNKKYMETKKLKIHKAYEKPPEGDISVDGVTGTAMLIDRDKLKLIDDWDTNIFNYFEDMDLCLRFRLKGFEIIKISDAEVDHNAFASHDDIYLKEMDFSRNWHYSWSRIYFLKKHTSQFQAFLFGFSLILTSSIKSILYFIFNRSKSITHFAKAYGALISILNLKPNYRPKIKL